jgi:hypothetical protein
MMLLQSPVAWIPPFLSQKTVAISFLAGRRLFKLFQHLIEKFIAIFVVSLLTKSEPKPFSAFSVHQWAFSESILRKACDDSLA